MTGGHRCRRAWGCRRLRPGPGRRPGEGVPAHPGGAGELPPRQGDRPRREGQGDRPKHDRPKGDRPKGDFKGKPNRDDRQKSFEARPPRPEKPIHPDNPFAALLALKAKV